MRPPSSRIPFTLAPWQTLAMAVRQGLGACSIIVEHVLPSEPLPLEPPSVTAPAEEG